MPVFNEGDTFQPDSFEVNFYTCYFYSVIQFKKEKISNFLVKRGSNRSAQTFDRSRFDCSNGKAWHRHGCHSCRTHRNNKRASLCSRDASEFLCTAQFGPRSRRRLR
jgi:hypothetical protein